MRKLNIALGLFFLFGVTVMSSCVKKGLDVVTDSIVTAVKNIGTCGGAFVRHPRISYGKKRRVVNAHNEKFTKVHKDKDLVGSK